MSASSEICTISMESKDDLKTLESRICSILRCEIGRSAAEFESMGYLSIRNRILRYLMKKSYPEDDNGYSSITFRFSEGLIADLQIIKEKECVVTLRWDFNVVYPENDKEKMIRFKEKSDEYYSSSDE